MLVRNGSIDLDEQDEKKAVAVSSIKRTTSRNASHTRVVQTFLMRARMRRAEIGPENDMHCEECKFSA